MQKNHFLLFKTLKNTESAQLCSSVCGTAVSPASEILVLQNRRLHLKTVLQIGTARP